MENCAFNSIVGLHVKYTVIAIIDSDVLKKGRFNKGEHVKDGIFLYQTCRFPPDYKYIQQFQMKERRS